MICPLFREKLHGVPRMGGTDGAICAVLQEKSKKIGKKGLTNRVFAAILRTKLIRSNRKPGRECAAMAICRRIDRWDMSMCMCRFCRALFSESCFTGACAD